MSNNEETTGNTENKTEENITENKTNITTKHPEDLNVFYVITSIVDQSELNILAEVLEIVDKDSYTDIITALRNHDKVKVLMLLGNLGPDKVDEFFDIFMSVYKDYYTPDSDYDDEEEDDNKDDNSIAGTTYKILTGKGQSSNTNQKNINGQNTKIKNLKEHNEEHKTNLNEVNQKNVQKAQIEAEKIIYDENYELNGNVYHSTYDYVNALLKAYEAGEIGYDELITILNKHHFDTGDINVTENGDIQWDYLYIRNGTVNINETLTNSTNNTDLNETNITNVENESVTNYS